jgi:uncharacterized protein YggE
LVILPAAAAQAQVGRTGGEGEISAMGHVHLQRPPTHLRMYLLLTAKGKTLEEALAALRERREAVAVQLEKLGADKKSVVFTAAEVDESAVAQQRRMETMIAQRLGGRGAKKSAKPAKTPLSVATQLTVQWPLTGGTTDKLLLAADAVREKVKAAALAGAKDTPKLSVEEQELAEEMAAEVARNSGNEEDANTAGEPRFLFLARLSPQDRQAALADAFAKAKQQAKELAKAAGVNLGSLTSVSGEAQSDVNGLNPSWRYSRFQRNDEFIQQLSQTAGGEESQGEAMALRPDATGFDFNIRVTFAIEAAKPEK